MNLSLFFFAASDCQVNNGHNGAPKWGVWGGGPCRGGDLKIFKADARVRGELHSNFHWLHEETAGIKLKAVFSRPLRRHGCRETIPPCLTPRTAATPLPPGRRLFSFTTPTTPTPPSNRCPPANSIRRRCSKTGALRPTKVSFVKRLRSLWRNLFEPAPPFSFAPRNTKQEREKKESCER